MSSSATSVHGKGGLRQPHPRVARRSCESSFRSRWNSLKHPLLALRTAAQCAAHYRHRSGLHAEALLAAAEASGRVAVTDREAGDAALANGMRHLACSIAARAAAVGGIGKKRRQGARCCELRCPGAGGAEGRHRGWSRRCRLGAQLGCQEHRQDCGNHAARGLHLFSPFLMRAAKVAPASSHQGAHPARVRAGAPPANNTVLGHILAAPLHGCPRRPAGRPPRRPGGPPRTAPIHKVGPLRAGGAGTSPLARREVALSIRLCHRHSEIDLPGAG